jgi:mannose/cellobiose epimerase-like protein (N-acyl-D-glucosamine 2-epimerase family)
VAVAAAVQLQEVQVVVLVVLVVVELVVLQREEAVLLDLQDKDMMVPLVVVPVMVVVAAVVLVQSVTLEHQVVLVVLEELAFRFLQHSEIQRLLQVIHQIHSHHKEVVV